MKKNLTELVFILDESGSMSGLTADTIGGFNSLISKQKGEEGEALVTTVFFSNDSKTVHDRLPVGEVPKLTDKEYVPSGCTALLDAVGDTIRHISDIHRYVRKEDVPEKTLFVITTDGMENASRRFTQSEVKKMITAQQEMGWEFLFLGANIDAAETAGSMGIRAENAVEYHSDSAGTGALFCSVASAVRSVRSKGCIQEDWCAEVQADNERRTGGSGENTGKNKKFGIFRK